METGNRGTTEKERKEWNRRSKINNYVRYWEAEHNVHQWKGPLICSIMNFLNVLNLLIKIGHFFSNKMKTEFLSGLLEKELFNLKEKRKQLW